MNGKAAETLRDLGRYLGAMIADGQPPNVANMVDILNHATNLGKHAYKEGMSAHYDLAAVFRTLAQCADALRKADDELFPTGGPSNLTDLADTAMQHLKDFNES